jgi:hypothetical protein
MWECVDLHISWLGGATADLSMKDLVTEGIMQAIPCERGMGSSEVVRRIGRLMDNYDHWWKNDPEGHAGLAAAVETYGLPWFDTARTLEDQAANWYGRRSRRRPWREPSTAALAVTLYRMGEFEEALALFDAPVPKTAMPGLVANDRCVERWLKRQVLHK